MEDQHKQLALSLIAYAAQRDIPTDVLCKNANIDLRAIKKKEKYAITKKQFDDLWLYASRLAKDPLFGLHFGESLQLSALGVVGEIIKSSGTVGEGITIAASLTGVVTDLFKMEVTKSKKKFVIQIIPTIPQRIRFHGPSNDRPVNGICDSRVGRFAVRKNKTVGCVFPICYFRSG